jgi:uncharacterized protein
LSTAVVGAARVHPPMAGTASCIYEGTISHRRAKPERQFVHRLALMYLDLAELPDLLGGRLLAPRPGAARFRRRDYFGDPRIELDTAVRDHVSMRLGRRPDGPIRLLTQLRSFGHCFNPVSFYYCLEDGGERIDAVLAEVTNTPWGERHAYVVPGGVGRLDKALHVSPFFAMQQEYVCRAGVPGRALSIRIESYERGSRVFEAALALRRRELTHDSLRRMTARYPLAAIRVLALIYGHAVGLALAGAKLHPHPDHRPGRV